MLTAAAILGVLSILLANESEISAMIQEREALDREAQEYALQYQERLYAIRAETPVIRDESSTVILVPGKAERAIVDEPVSSGHNFTDRR